MRRLSDYPEYNSQFNSFGSNITLPFRPPFIALNCDLYNLFTIKVFSILIKVLLKMAIRRAARQNDVTTKTY